MDIKDLIKPEISYKSSKNVFHFINLDDERPQWSINLNNFLVNNPKTIQMGRSYQINKARINNDPQKIEFFQYLTELGGVIVDLASGPSGYFSPVFNYMKDDSVFIATDACKAVINAHQKANKDKHFYVFDVDLDKKLPFKDESIDAFSGNLLNNIDNYRSLISEISRCLKPGGRFAVIEIFYEKDSKTYEFLKQRNAIFSSLEYFIEVCNEAGLKYKKSEIRREIIGKMSEGDLLPIGENDKCLETILYLEKC